MKNWRSFLILLYVNTALSVPINIVLLECKNESVSRIATRTAIETIRDTKIKLEVVSVSENSTADTLCELIFNEDKMPTLVIDSIRKTYFEQNKLSDSLRLLLRNMGVPTVSFSPNFSPWPGPPLTDVEKQFLIHIVPSELIMSQVVKSIMALIGSKKTLIIFESTTFGAVKNKAGLIFDNIGSGIIMEEINYQEEIKTVLNKIKSSGATNIFIFGSEAMAKIILIKASTWDDSIFNKEYAWFVLTKDETKLICNDFKSNAKVILIQPTVYNDENKNIVDFSNMGNKLESGFYYDFTQHLSTLLNKTVGVEEGWPETLTYPACGNRTTEENMVERQRIKLRDHLEAMQSSGNFKGTFGNFVIKNEESKKPFGRQDIRMKISIVTYGNGTSTIEDKLEWQYSEMKKPVDQFIGKTDGIENHKGALLIQITTIHDPPFVYKTIKNDKVVFEGLCIDLLEILRKEANFTFEYVITENDENKHGEMKPDGSFDGMIGDLMKGKADLAIGPIAVMAERELVVDFTVPFYDLVGISILMKRKKVESAIFKFLTVLEADVWGCIIAAYFFTSFLLFLFDRLSPYSVHNNQEKYKDDDEKRDFSLKESLWFCITSLTPQGGGEAPKNLSGRLVSATWWLFGFIIIASYTANLAAFLTVSRLDYSIENLDDLAKQYKIKYSTVIGSLANNYFRRMKDVEERFYEIWKNMSLDDSLNETERAKLAVWDYPVSDRFTKIWWTMQESTFFLTLEDGISKTLHNSDKDGYAFLGESYVVKYAALEHCELKQVGPEFGKRPISWAITKGSSLNEPFSQVFLKVLNERRIEELKDKWWNKNPYAKKCYHYVKKDDGIELNNIGGIFFVMFGGVALAVITLIIEFFYFKMLPSKNKVITVKGFKAPTIASTPSFEKTKDVKF